ncbi:MAG: 4-alpha-glucanotransferase [Prevotellaceae bacterium]|nr:4-alpha-glucanotransferase [Prevotellaceae bacterium]
MKFHFSIEYNTQWGEDLRLIIGEETYALSTLDGQRWETDIELNAKSIGTTLTYQYALYRDGQLVWTEWDVAPHAVLLNHTGTNKTVKDDDRTFTINDYWRPIPEDLPLFSSAFADGVASHGTPAPEDLPTFNQTLQLRIVEPRLLQHQRLGICGNTPLLGNWERAVPLTLIGLQEWGISLNTDDIFHPIEYKYVITDADGNITAWEEGPNRRISSLALRKGETWIKTDSSVRLRLPNWKCAGVVIPVFSLRTAKSYGIGDFGDLQEMIRWAAHVGMHAVQILPINDTITTHTWQDSYPYNAISIYAFNPIYCDISALPRLENKLQMETFLMQQQELNVLPQIDFEKVLRLKTDYLRQAYEQEGKQVLASADFKAYFDANKEWLVPYAAFCYLRDTYGTADFSTWEKHSTYDRAAISRLCSPRGKNYAGIALHYYIQYQLHLQLTAVRNTARQEGVIIKGDIPIGISRTSVEAWTEPQYFHFNSQAGAPPDDFSRNGQNWGFPTYNWKAMLADGCSWWVRRFRKMAEYFDAYRIDHVLGFFRIWDIPQHSVHGLLGHFSPSLPMSQSEIESYGFQFNRELMTQPYINDNVLFSIFGYRAELVKTLYLVADTTKSDQSFNAFGGPNTFYRLRPEYDTQRKVQAAFAHKTDEEALTLRDGLYTLISNVLFVIDRDNPQMYHPRISAQLDDAFRSLTESQQRAFNHLYDDYYYHRHNQFWYDEAMKKLPHLTQSTRMLICAEDLGMVPACVEWVMNQLRILSLEIQTMPKAYGVQFGHLSDNPYRSVATISTHDMPTMRQWWDEDPTRTQQFYNTALHIDGEAPHPLPGWVAEEIVNRHLYSPSMLCLLSLQDWLAIDERVRNKDIDAERINIPADPRHYWRWRMHVSIEQLQQNDTLNDHIRTMIQRSGR